MILHFDKCKAGLKFGGRSLVTGRSLELFPLDKHKISVTLREGRVFTTLTFQGSWSACSWDLTWPTTMFSPLSLFSWSDEYESSSSSLSLSMSTERSIIKEREKRKRDSVMICSS